MDSTDSSESESEPFSYPDPTFETGETSHLPEQFTQSELNDLVRDLNLPKISVELLGSRLKEKKLLYPCTTFSWYRHREREFIPLFSQTDKLVYCKNVEGLFMTLGVQYNPADWRFFVDSSLRSMKGVLLHNGNLLSSLPLAYSVDLKETYNNLKLMLDKIEYGKHSWTACGDFKVLTILLGQQSGFTKYPCFLCEWDSRARSEHWERKHWPLRTNLLPGEKNVLSETLISRKKVLLPPLHIKLGLMKQFVTSLSNESNIPLLYLQNKFPNKSDVKLKAGVFDGPQIRQLMRDSVFTSSMNKLETSAWLVFKKVTKNFLGNNKAENYREIVEEMLEHFKALGCKMSVKVHFLYSHIDYFPNNLGAVSEEQGERFHQDIKTMETRY